MTIAREISDRVKRELGITVSIGVSDNKVTANLGSDYKKPDAITRIEADNYKEIVYPPAGAGPCSMWATPPSASSIITASARLAD